MPDLKFHLAGIQDAPALAEMNQRLIRDEGHRNLMGIEELTARITGWLGGDYEAVLFSRAESAVGYALYRREPDHVYLRQFFVELESRRQGVGRRAIKWMWDNVWQDVQRLRLDVLIGNQGAHAFWESVGFSDYCITMEAERARP